MTLRTIALIGLASATAYATACAKPGQEPDPAGGPAPARAQVTGTVTYRVRRALLPDAVITVQLLDVSLADAPSKLIAEQTIRGEGRQVPIPFAIAYDPARIDPRHTYAVRATITEADAPSFNTRDAYHVITRGSPTTVEIVVHPLREGARGPQGKVQLDLGQLDDDGLYGPADGKRALSYEFCIPGGAAYEREVRGIDSTVALQRGASGRVGCDDDEVLCIGSTHQPGFREVLDRLAALPYVQRIEPFWGEV